MNFQLIISRNRKRSAVYKIEKKNKIILKTYVKIIILMDSSFFMLIDFVIFLKEGL